MPDGANKGSFVQGCNAKIAADSASQVTCGRCGYAGDERQRIIGADDRADRGESETEAGRAMYKMRKAIVEPVFGQIKEQRGFRRFSLRGKENVSREWKLVCAVSNLLKLFLAGGVLKMAKTAGKEPH
jgi:hypothetical protein